MTTAVTNKKIMRELYYQDAFGNHLRSWTYNNFIAQNNNQIDFNNPIGLMYNGIPGTKLPRYAENLYSLPELELTVLKWFIRGAEPEKITVSEVDNSFGKRILQGEVQEYEGILNLTYTFVDDLMRKALEKESHHTSGLKAKLILEYFMDTASYENLTRLFDEYPSHVIEFSVLDRCCGILSYNTLFWEVRKY